MNKNIYKYCIQLLSKREYSEQKIRDKILQKNIEKCECEEIIAQLKRDNFLSPQRYQKDKIINLANKGFSIDYIQSKLQEEQIALSSDYVLETIEEMQLNTRTIIKHMLDKKLSQYVLNKNTLTPEQLTSKAMLFLSSKGYDYYQAIDLLPKELSENIN